MDAGALKGLEVIVIAGAVAWFYFSQTNSLKRLKKEREELEKNAGGSGGVTGSKGAE